MTEKKALWRSGETLVSASSRTRLGSWRPAWANSTRVAGRVAEKSSVWREVGRAWRISVSCVAKPISKSLSASSNTTYCMDRRSSAISTMRCRKRPGVAMMMSGLVVMEPNCSSRLSPPTRSTVLRSVPLPSSLTTLRVWMASSREGDMISARVPTLTLWPLRRSIMGMTKAAVFPDPVRAMPTTSFRLRSRGIVLRWMGVGTLKPFFAMAFRVVLIRPVSSWSAVVGRESVCSGVTHPWPGSLRPSSPICP